MDETGATLEMPSQSVHRTNEIGGGPVSGDTYSPTLETSGSRSTGVKSERYVASGRRTAAFESVEPKFKHKALAIFAVCAEGLDAAIGESDLVLRSNAFDQMKDSLAELWGIRDKREEQFAEVVNMLQFIVANRGVEDFNDGQLATMRSVFVKLSNTPLLDDEFANEITMDLLKGGIDAFREID